MLVRADNGEEVAWSQVPYVNGVLDRWLPDDTPLGMDWALQDPRDYLFVLEHGVLQYKNFHGIVGRSRLTEINGAQHWLASTDGQLHR